MSEELRKVGDQGDSYVDESKIKSAKTLTTVVYALQAISFIVGITFIAAVIINHLKRGDVEGTWLASHFRWQIRTFWYSVLWMILGFITIFIFIGYLILLADMVWVVYRVVKGWLRLTENKEMYVQSAGKVP